MANRQCYRFLQRAYDDIRNPIVDVSFNPRGNGRPQSMQRGQPASGQRGGTRSQRRAYEYQQNQHFENDWSAGRPFEERPTKQRGPTERSSTWKVPRKRFGRRFARVYRRWKSKRRPRRKGRSAYRRPMRKRKLNWCRRTANLSVFPAPSRVLKYIYRGFSNPQLSFKFGCGHYDNKYEVLTFFTFLLLVVLLYEIIFSLCMVCL